jgi:hypothetical protein
VQKQKMNEEGKERERKKRTKGGNEDSIQLKKN